ncbi:MAG TPA: CocE/NonD family hydrolase [Bacteroidota bacterium]|nr:CocE/NonD family hydrolase [Bacteroidota bacterium]
MFRQIDPKRIRMFGTAFLLLLCSTALLFGQMYPVAQHYNKHEYMIPMRDGVKLYTAVYTPIDTTKEYPILLNRTPYSSAPYGESMYPPFVGSQAEKFYRDGYIMVSQDVRGRYMSEGEYLNVRPYIENKKSNKDIDESSDTYDTVDWLVKHIAHNNGRAGIYGISYPGFYSTTGTIDAHPAMKATSPQAPVSKWMAGDDFFHNGAFLLPHAFDFFASFGWPRLKPTTTDSRPFNHGITDGYKFFLELGPLPNANVKYFKDSVSFWNDIMNHGTWDSFWEARNILPHVKNIKPATLVVGGWYDSENLYGALNLFASINKFNPKNQNRLVMGPWSHGQWGYDSGDSLGLIKWGSSTGRYFVDSIIYPYFSYYLKGQGEMHLAKATVFETGTNVWRFLDAWPPPNAVPTNLYVLDHGKLSFTAPTKTDKEGEFDEYVSDPSKPVPYTAEIRHWYNAAFPVEDQRFAWTRPDVMVYESDVLQDDVTVAGPITASICVSTSGTDSDWIVKLIDVLPETVSLTGGGGRRFDSNATKLRGYQMMVRGDVIRGKFRNSMSKPEPFVPNKVTKIEYTLNDIFHTFKKGHRIMVQIQSSWFPMIDRNPQTFVDIYHAKESDFKKATQRVYHSPEWSTHLVLPILK